MTITYNARTSICKALATKCNAITVANGYRTELYENANAGLKFWDEINQFPAVYITAGMEYREVHPAGFAWGLLTISIKAYVKDGDPQEDLEVLIGDLEHVINSNLSLVYNADLDCGQTADMSIISIQTDEGLLTPYGVGEIILQARYQVLTQ